MNNVASGGSVLRASSAFLKAGLAGGPRWAWNRLLVWMRTNCSGCCGMAIPRALRPRRCGGGSLRGRRRLARVHPVERACVPFLLSYSCPRAERVLLSGQETPRGRHCVYPEAHRREPRGQPPPTLGQIMRRLELGAAQWSLARHGLPRTAAGAGSGRTHCLAGPAILPA